jgi:ankyrin repeat protein
VLVILPIHIFNDDALHVCLCVCVKYRAAAARGDMAVVQLLLSRGADITAADASLSTPFLAAVNGGHEAVAMLLLAQQPPTVDLNTRVFGSNCALYCAAGEGLLRVTKALLQRGADCNVSTVCGVQYLAFCTCSAVVVMF